MKFYLSIYTDLYQIPNIAFFFFLFGYTFWQLDVKYTSYTNKWHFLFRLALRYSVYIDWESSSYNLH